MLLNTSNTELLLYKAVGFFYLPIVSVHLVTVMQAMYCIVMIFGATFFYFS